MNRREGGYPVAPATSFSPQVRERTDILTMALVNMTFVLENIGTLMGKLP